MTTNSVGSTGSSLAEFLAESGPGARTAGSTTAVRERFSAALAKAASEAGIPPEQLKVSVEEHPAAEGGKAQQRMIVTVGAAPEVASDPIETALETPAEPIPPAAESVPVEWITKDKWAENNLLTGDLSAETLRRVVDPSELLNARLEAVREPTDAQVIDDGDGAAQGINASGLSTLEQAQAMLDRLEALGIGADEIVDLELGGPYRMDFGSDNRRYYLIDGHNVGHLIERYAKLPVEVADQITLNEFS